MADAQATIIVPEELRKKYPELIGLILHSESMNDEERQYWVNILPVMTPEQIQNLFQILDNESKQLAAIDAKYNKEMQRLNQGKSADEVRREREEKRRERTVNEEAHGEEEKRKEEEILSAIQGL